MNSFQINGMKQKNYGMIPPHKPPFKMGSVDGYVTEHRTKKDWAA